MKKIIFLFSFFLLLGTSFTVDANRYGGANYTIYRNGWFQNCWTDGDAWDPRQVSGTTSSYTFPSHTIPWTCYPWYNMSIPAPPGFVWIPGYCDPDVLVHDPGTMWCQYWDATAPSISANNTSSAWRNTSVTVNLTASDTGGSGLWVARYRWNVSATTWGTSYSHGQSISYGSDGIHTLYLYAADNAGNSSNQSFTQYKIDTRKPIITLSDTNSAWRAPFSLTAGAVEDTSLTPNVSGIEVAKYKWDSPPNCSTPALWAWENSLWSSTSITVWPPYWSHTLYLCAKDVAWNTETRSQLYQIDNIWPVISASPTSHAWTNSNITVNLSCSDPQWTTCTKLQYAWSTSPSPSGYSSTVTGTNPSTSTTLTSEWVWYLHVRAEDAAMPNVTTDTFWPYMIDKTAPTAADISNSMPNDLLANNSFSYSISAGTNGGSPITSIAANSENYTNIWTTPRNASSWNLSFAWDMSDVDLDRWGNGWRQYTFRVTSICDQAGNCGSLTYARNHNVYSNTNLLSTTHINQIDDGTVADGTTRSLQFTLQDTYGNIVIPATGIGRTVDFNFNNVNNSVYLNQHARTWNAVFVNRPNAPWSFLNRFALWTNSVVFSNEPSTNGSYTYGFKFYTPTASVSDPSAAFGINNVALDINGSLWARTNVALVSGITASYTSLFTSDFWWQVETDGFIEWAEQTASLSVTKAVSSANPSYNKILEYGIVSGWVNAVNTKADMYWGTAGNTNTTIDGPISTTNIGSSSWNSSASFYTRLKLKVWQTLSALQGSYLSSHISYSLDGNAIVLNGDVVGKTQYFDATVATNTAQSAVKILGQTYSKQYAEIISGQEGTDVQRLQGDITKSTLKTQVRENVFKYIKNVSVSNGSKTVTNIDNFALNTAGVKLDSNKILYFGSESSAYNVTVGGTSSSTTAKTIVVVWGNIYITSNIDYAGNLWLIALKNDAWQWGNIYIHPDVGTVKASLYADKSLISYNGVELDGNTSFSTLKHQLYIYGTVFSENTIWGSVMSPVACPFYVIATCTQIEAQKYDLNYLRRYYLKDNNWDGDVDDAWDTPAGGWATSNTTYRKYPVVIEYNSKVQISPPPFFDL